MQITNHKAPPHQQPCILFNFLVVLAIVFVVIMLQRASDQLSNETRRGGGVPRSGAEISLNLAKQQQDQQPQVDATLQPLTASDLVPIPTPRDPKVLPRWMQDWYRLIPRAPNPLTLFIRGDSDGKSMCLAKPSNRNNNRLPGNGRTSSNSKKKKKIAVITIMAAKPSSSPSGSSSVRINGNPHVVPMRETMRKLAFTNFAGYCARHGYSLIVEDEVSVAKTLNDPEILPEQHRDRYGNTIGAQAWAKVLVLRKWLPHFDWLMWIDMDALIVDWDAKIEDIVGASGDSENDSSLSSVVRQQLKQKKQLKTYVAPNNADEINSASSSTRDIDLILIAEPVGVNTGVFFLRNSDWSRDFMLRVFTSGRSEWPHWEQDCISYLLNLFKSSSSGGKSGAAAGLKPQHNPNTARIESDRKHVVVLEDNSWNKPWWTARVIFRKLSGGDATIRRDWMFPFDEWLEYTKKSSTRSSTPSSLALLPRPAGVVVHFIACVHVQDLCLDWMRFMQLQTACRFGGEVASPFVEVPRQFGV